LSYLEGLPKDPAYLSVASALGSDPAGQSSLVAALSSIEGIVLAGSTLPASFIQALPTEARSVVSSILSVESSIAVENGITPQGTAPATQPAANPTGLPTISSTPAPPSQTSTPAAQTSSSVSNGANPTGQFSNSTTTGKTSSTTNNPNPAGQSSSSTPNAARATGGMLGASAGIIAGFVGAAVLL
jgi:hypothetical protein